MEWTKSVRLGVASSPTLFNLFRLSPVLKHKGDGWAQCERSNASNQTDSQLNGLAGQIVEHVEWIWVQYAAMRHPYIYHSSNASSSTASKNRLFTSVKSKANAKRTPEHMSVATQPIFVTCLHSPHALWSWCQFM